MQLAAIGIDGSPPVADFEELYDAIRQLGELEAVVVAQRPWPTERIAHIVSTIFRIPLDGIADRRFEPLLSLRRIWGTGTVIQNRPIRLNIPGIAAPHARQIMLVKRVCIDAFFSPKVAHVSSVCTTGARLPAWSWSHHRHFQARLIFRVHVRSLAETSLGESCQPEAREHD